jgi:nicotinamide mononucleotide transporter
LALMNRTLALLTFAAGALAVAMALAELASWLEAISFVTGAVCVWLTVKQNVWNFPIGLANVATFSVVFYRSGLFADAGLQVVYFVLGVIGWWLWLHGGQNRTRLKVSRASALELAALVILATVATIGMWKMLHTVGGSASFWDALTTSISLASQWLLNRKRLESWFGWILVDVIYIPLYAYKELYLTAILYAVFLVMATMGLRAWRDSLRGELQSVSPLEPEEAAMA